MIKITLSADCGNSPKKLLLQQFTVACFEGDLEFVASHIRDDVQWEIVGNRFLQGKQEFIARVAQAKDFPIAELSISTIITHGKEGTVMGRMQMADGKSYAFCDVYTFDSAKGTHIKSMVSFEIKTSA